MGMPLAFKLVSVWAFIGINRNWPFLASPSSRGACPELLFAARLLIGWTEVETPCEGRFELAVEALPVGSREERDQYSEERLLALPLVFEYPKRLAG